MAQSFNVRKANWIRSMIVCVWVGISSCHVASQTYYNKARVVGANRVRMEVFHLQLREDGTYEFVISNYMPTFWGKQSEENQNSPFSFVSINCKSLPHNTKDDIAFLLHQFPEFGTEYSIIFCFFG